MLGNDIVQRYWHEWILDIVLGVYLTTDSASGYFYSQFCILNKM